MSTVHLRRLLLPVLLLAFLLVVTGQAQTAHAACTPGTVLCDRFGVELKLQNASLGGGTPGGTGLPFDLSSFVPTNPSPSIDYIVGDWYGSWSLTDVNGHNDITRPSPPNFTNNDWWPSGSEPYDTEAYYFDSDAENFYLAIVSSVPPYQYIGTGTQRWGVYETRSGIAGLWIPPSDIAIDLHYGDNTPPPPVRAEANSTFWHYDYGLNLVHENRDSFGFVGTYSSATGRDYSIGTDLWKTNTDSQPINQSNDNPGPGLSDWYTAVGTGAVTAFGEHTSFDPLASPTGSHSNMSPAMTKAGDVTTVNWYEYIFPGGQLENDTGTYIVEVVIPRALFGADNPVCNGKFAFRYGTTCRNDGDGNGTNWQDPMLKIVANVDDAASCANADWGDAPDSYGTLFSSSGANHTISGTFMGARVDAEASGQPNAAATGDDINPASADDEDGVSFTSLLTPGAAATIAVDMTASTAACTLSSWIDFDGNGAFDPVDQLSFTSCVGCTSGVPGTAPLLTAGGTATLNFNVPGTALGGATYARFRCTSAAVGAVGPTGPAADGEVEDYLTSIDVNVDWDYGDLPDTYTTLAASNGARHVMSSNLFLGACVDGETTGAPDAQAGMGAMGGDDHGAGSPIYPTSATCSDDEDGVTLVTPLIPGNQACVAVTANNAVAGVLQGWIDFDGSGAFDSSEALTFAGGGAVSAGTVNQNYCFTVPAGATFFGGQAYMRFRLSSAGGLSWSGPAANGEVEDYWQPLACVGNYVWQDYNGDGLQNEAGSFGIDGVGVNLTWFGFDNVAGGAGVNADITYSTITAPEGSVNGKYLFCGLTPSNGAGNGGAYQISIPTPPLTYGLATTYLVGGNTPLNSDGQQTGGAGGPITAPPFTLSGLSSVPPFPNLRIDENGAGDQVGAGATGIGYTNFPNNQDDVSTDFGLRATSLDLGDLPSTSFATQKANNGPSHVLDNNLYLGTCVDGEADGQQNTAATGDDAAAGTIPAGFPACTNNDDEDGVILVTPLIAGQQACVSVTAKNTLVPNTLSAVLQGWIDWNGSNNFDVSEALTFTSAGAGAVPNGGGVTNQQYCFTVPAGATFAGGQAYMRFRLSSAGSLSWTGPADNGEVEDYRVPLACVGNLVWNDANKNGIQDTDETALDTTVYMVWAGPNGTVETPPGNTTASPPDDRIYSAATAAGKYQFCGVIPGAYQLKVVTPPASYPYATTPNATGSTDFTDSDGVQSGGSGAPSVIPAFTIGSITGLPLSENGLFDGTPMASFPDTQEDRSYDFGYSASPLAVLLAGFDATAQTDHVLVSWETVSEASNSGFNLYRSLAADGEYTLLGFTPSASPGSTVGAAYSYQDADVLAGQTYWYWLEDMDLNGAATLHGPVSVVFQAPTAVELSGLAADGGPGSLALPSLLAALLVAGAAALLVDRRRRSAA